MDELQSYQRERPRPSEEKREKKRSGRRDYLVRVIAVQLAVCAVLLTGAFLMVKTNPNAQKALREAYEGILSQDWSAQEAAAAFKEIGAFIFAPADSWPDADDPTQAAQANAAAGASETMGAAAAQGKEPSTESPSQPDETVSQEALDGMGGSDEPLFDGIRAPVEGTSFAPYIVSVPVVRPVEGRVTSSYGYRIHPITKKLGFHRGMDIAAAMGTRIAAAFYGTVKEVGYSEGNGNYITLTHENGLETTYCHCSEILAEEGTVIREGETIALVGDSGMATGPHLHIEVRINGVLHSPSWILGADNAYEKDAV